MNINLTRFFPSLYDPPHVVDDIWGSPFWIPDSDMRLLETRPWPDTSELLLAEYRPLDFYAPPPGVAAEQRSEVDDISELYIRLKEIELLYQMEEEFDDTRCCYERTVQCEKGVEERQSFKKKTKPFVKNHK